MPLATRRKLLIGVAATGLFASMARAVRLTGAASGAGCWPHIAAPEAPRVDQWIDQLGRRRNDPYAWLKYVPDTGQRSEATLPPMIRSHLRAEADYAEATLAPLRARQEEFVTAMLVRSRGQAGPPPLRQGPWLYKQYIPAGADRPVHVREGEDGGEELLVDESERAAGHAYYRATDFQPSPDHRFYVWAEDVTGDDRHRICVRDTRDGSVRIIVPGDAFGYGGLTVSPGSRYLFWISRDARNRPTRLYRSPLGGGEPVLVYEEQDPAIFMQVARTAADGFVALTLAGPDISEVYLFARGAETEPPRLVQPRATGVSYEIIEWDGGLLMLTDSDGALDRKLLRLDSDTLTPTDTLVAHRSGRPIIAVLPFERGLVLLERQDGLHRLTILHRDGTRHSVGFDDTAYALTLPPAQDYGASAVRIGHETPHTPPRCFDIDLASGKRSLVTETRLPGFDPEAYEVERIEAMADDGIAVPVTILSRRDAPKDGTQPLLLYGYGAYGVSSDPVFSLPATALVDAGWRYAIAHVRGGSEKGRRWFREGRRFKKRNSMTDFIACASALIDQGYSAPGRICAYGLSAGGLLVGGAMNIAPRLWGGVIAKVPFVDMLNTMSDADHPLVPLFRPDWGDPLADARAYDYIASISPYENVHPAPYPPLLCTAGLKDDRVSYWEPAKLVAAVRRETTGGQPAILLIDAEAGHQGSADRRSEFAEMGLFWAFAERCLANCPA